MTRPVNICVHGIGTPARQMDPDEDGYWIGTEVFERICDYAASGAPITLSFDDGNSSDIEIALPSLVARGLRASFFPVAARIGRPGSIDEAGLRSLVEHGMTVGSHGMHHKPWKLLDKAGLDQELVRAREIIAAAAGAPVSTAACPLGSYGRVVLRRLRALNYTRVFTSDRATTHEKAWLQPRFSVRSTDSIDDVRAIVDHPRSLLHNIASAAWITHKRWK